MHLILVEEMVKSELDEKLSSQIVSDLLSECLKGKIGEVEIMTQLQSN
ncbi:MAG: hypothetical protein F6K38_26530 [Moorea sp. SIO3B2]|nr:hypothetical protein [Moorena sp. SIO3B2]